MVDEKNQNQLCLFGGIPEFLLEIKNIIFEPL